MRNKRYRPVKLWIILISVIIIFAFFGIFLLDSWRQIVMLIGVGLITICMALTLTYYFEIKDDRIIIRHGLSSFNKKYRSSFKTRIILINEINSIDLSDWEKAIVINLKDANSICFPISGYFHHSEIVKLVYDIKKQLVN